MPEKIPHQKVDPHWTQRICASHEKSNGLLMPSSTRAFVTSRARSIVRRGVGATGRLRVPRHRGEEARGPPFPQAIGGRARAPSKEA